MIIALTTSHPAAEELTSITTLLRAQRRGDKVDNAPPSLQEALNITETNHGNRTATYAILPGRASSEVAIMAYQYVRKHYPSILDILCHATSREATEITIEVGTMSRQDKISYSHHDLLNIMPRILAIFRGTVRAR